MLDIGLSELLIILAVALIVLGPKKLPEIARSLGRGLAEFRRTSDDLRRSLFLEEEEHAKRTTPDATPSQPLPSHSTGEPSEYKRETQDTGTDQAEPASHPPDADAPARQDRDKE